MEHYPERKKLRREKYMDEGQNIYGIKKLRLKDLEKGLEKRHPNCQACQQQRHNISVHILTECNTLASTRDQLKITEDINKHQQELNSREAAVRVILGSMNNANMKRLTKLVQKWEKARTNST